MLDSQGHPRPNVTGRSGWFNVNFRTVPIRQFARSVGAATARPVLRAGDLYVFSSSRLHETFDVLGKQPRSTRASFLAYNSFEEGGQELLYQ